jgi:hypothetical protein
MIQKTPLGRVSQLSFEAASRRLRTRSEGRLGAMRGYLSQLSEAGKFDADTARRGTASVPSLRHCTPVTISPQ